MQSKVLSKVLSKSSQQMHLLTYLLTNQLTKRTWNVCVLGTFTYKGDAMEEPLFAGADGMAAVERDARRVFGWDPERRPQDRAHDYLRERGVRRGSDDTAMECVALDLVGRAARAAVDAAALGEYAHVVADALRTTADSVEKEARDAQA